MLPRFASQITASFTTSSISSLTSLSSELPAEGNPAVVRIRAQTAWIVEIVAVSNSRSARARRSARCKGSSFNKLAAK